MESEKIQASLDKQIERFSRIASKAEGELRQIKSRSVLHKSNSIESLRASLLH
jgi:hypothetical protein